MGNEGNENEVERFLDFLDGDGEMAINTKNIGFLMRAVESRQAARHRELMEVVMPMKGAIYGEENKPETGLLSRVTAVETLARANRTAMMAVGSVAATLSLEAIKRILFP
jgi:hypothetical protein